MSIPHASTDSHPVLVAHRGLSARAPENTLPAFQKAVEEGAQWLELDLQLSADDELVVFHDATLHRTTNGTGYVRNKNLRELGKLDAGGWFSKTYSGTTIPTLEEVFTNIPQDVHLDIEIKPRAARGVAGEVLAERLTELVRLHDRMDSILVTSFSEHALGCVRRAAGDIRLGFLHHGRPSVRNVLGMLEMLQVDWYGQNVLTISRNMVKTLQARGVTVGVYTVNSTRTLRHALRCGVDCVITNDVRDLRERLLSDSRWKGISGKEPRDDIRNTS